MKYLLDADKRRFPGLKFKKQEIEDRIQKRRAISAPF
jgi:hypothetical protein